MLQKYKITIIFISCFVLLIALLTIINFSIHRFYTPSSDEKDNDFFTRFTFLKNREITVTADDGAKIVIKEQNPKRAHHIEVYSMDDFGNSVSFVLCKNGTHFLAKIKHPEDYFNKYIGDYKLSLKKVKSYEHVTEYLFIFTFNINEKIKEEMTTYNYTVWMDIEHDKYCGGEFYYPVSTKNILTKTKTGQKFYNYTSDMFLSWLQDGLTNGIKSLDEYDYFYDIKIFTYGILDMISVYDFDKGEELNAELSELIQRRDSMKDQFRNQTYLIEYTSAVWQLKEYQRTPITEKNIMTIDIHGLPSNEKELENYLKWVAAIFDVKYPIEDNYTTKIEFKLTADGLEAVSAGRDKIFGTKDDQNYLSRYDEVEIYNKVTRPQLL